MSGSGYHQMSNIAAHGTQKQGGAYRENFQMPRRQVPGMAGGDVNSMSCAFPAPPPFRTYCGPAQFHALNSGENYAKLVNAYGFSRPSYS